MSKREPIGAKLRFEVFKRDSFTCQYCGQKAPDVILHVDHINPVSKGGGNDILNLVTACASCNGGKGARLLTDRAEIEKQRAQLDELNERRQQLEWLLEWRSNLEEFERLRVSKVAEDWHSRVPGFEVNDAGLRDLAKWDKRFGTELLLAAIKASAEQYVETVDGAPTEESVGRAFTMIPRVANGMKTSEDKPWMRDVFYVRAVLRNRLNYVSERDVIWMTEEAILLGVDVDRLKEFSKQVRNWSEYRDELTSFIKANRPPEDDE